MSIPYEQLFSSGNATPRSPYMRLPSYQSLRRQRYHPYKTTHTRPLFGATDMMELAEDVDFETDVLLAHVNEIPSFSLPMIPEDEWVVGLRTVVSQMVGRDGAHMRLGFVHLVIDFALILRSRLRQRGPAVPLEAATPNTLEPSM